MSTTTVTPDEYEAIREYFATHEIPAGLGTESGACTIAAINLQLTGRLSDDLHPCMSPVIRNWVIRVQDSMPASIRNSKEWKVAAVGIAGSFSPAHEEARKALILDWMWGTVLPTLQPTADRLGFGGEWLDMTTKRTADYALIAKRAAAYAAAADAAAAGAYDAAHAAAHAASAAQPAASAAYAAADAAADAAAADAAGDARLEVWGKFNPAGLLAQLVAYEGSLK